MLEGKRVLIISPQRWGQMRISKHHYAVEFQRIGAEVVYLTTFHENPVSDVIENIKVVGYNRPFFYRLKFHAYPIYLFLLKYFTPRIEELKERWDIVVSFDLGGDFPISVWKSSVLIYFPVDFPHTGLSVRSGDGADYILSVANGILDEFDSKPGRKVNLGHSVSEDFEALWLSESNGGIPIRKVGYAGNLTRSDVDFGSLKEIALRNPEVEFHFWGAFESSQSNLGGGLDENYSEMLLDIVSLANVMAYGPVDVKALASAYDDMDAFLICYDPVKDQSKCLNYHKILEYFSTGKVIISNRIHEYEGCELIAMASDFRSNRDLPDVFASVVENAAIWNSVEMCLARKSLASQSTYALRLRSLLSLISN